MRRERLSRLVAGNLPVVMDLVDLGLGRRALHQLDQLLREPRPDERGHLRVHVILRPRAGPLNHRQYLNV